MQLLGQIFLHLRLSKLSSDELVRHNFFALGEFRLHSVSGDQDSRPFVSTTRFRHYLHLDRKSVCFFYRHFENGCWYCLSQKFFVCCRKQLRLKFIQDGPEERRIMSYNSNHYRKRRWETFISGKSLHFIFIYAKNTLKMQFKGSALKIVGRCKTKFFKLCLFSRD